MSTDLKTTGVILEGGVFKVEPYPWDTVEELGPSAFKKGIAYRYVTDLTDALFPYRGITDDDFSRDTSKVGIWFKKGKHGVYKRIIIWPRNSYEASEYYGQEEKDFIAAVLGNEYSIDRFTDPVFTATDSGTDIYRPPIHSDDDHLNLLMKMGIRLKNAPFEPYGKRLQALAVNRKKGVEGQNIKNNARRGIRLNRALSCGKFTQYGDNWQFEAAFILRDAPNAMHPMNIPKGKMLVIYPSGIPFDIRQEDLIDISDMIADAIATDGKESDQVTNAESNNNEEEIK